jgi:hypothetical protein
MGPKSGSQIVVEGRHAQPAAQAVDAVPRVHVDAPIVFAWPHFFAMVKTLALLGLINLFVNFRQVEKAYREIGLGGFAQVGLGLVCLCFLGVGTNYLWCLALRELARQRSRRGQR